MKSVPSGGTLAPLVVGPWWVLGVLGSRLLEVPKGWGAPPAPFCPQVLPEQPYPCRDWWFGASRVDGMDAWCLPLQLCGDFLGRAKPTQLEASAWVLGATSPGVPGVQVHRGWRHWGPPQQEAPWVLVAPPN